MSSSGQPAPPRLAPPRPPTEATTVDQLAQALVQLRHWAGSPSFSEIARRIQHIRARRGISGAHQAPGRVTIYDCFRDGRARLDGELVCDIVTALGAASQLNQWRSAHAKIEGLAVASEIVQAQTGRPTASPHYTSHATSLAKVVQSDSSATAIVGLPGVGKTEFVRQVVHELIERGRCQNSIYVNLRGYDESLPPASPVAVLVEILRAVGAAQHNIRSRKLGELVPLTRKTLTQKSLIVVLDNAGSRAQVEPLISACANTTLFVTSRRQLNLGIPELNLEVLTASESVELVQALAPDAPLREEPALAGRLAELCGYLPLHLVLLAARLQETPTWSLADQVARLEALPASAMLQPAFGSSYRSLKEQDAFAFRAMAQHPTDLISVEALVALTDLSLDQVTASISQLEAEFLLARSSDGRVYMHDLVRAFAAQMNRDLDPLSQRKAAAIRLADYYSAACHRACKILGFFPLVDVDEPQTDPRLIADLSDAINARHWLVRETQTIINTALTGVDVSESSQCLPEVARLTLAITPWLLADGRYFEAELLNKQASTISDPLLRTSALVNLGQVLDHLGEFDRAYQTLSEAQRSTTGLVRAALLNQLAIAAWSVGHVAEAIRHHEEAVALARAAADRRLLAQYLAQFAFSLQFRGDVSLALTLLNEAMDNAKKIEDLELQSTILMYLCDTYTYADNYAPAEAAVRETLQIQEQLGSRQWLGRNLASLGRILTLKGEWKEAEKLLLESLDEARQLSMKYIVGEALACYGGLLAATERGIEALEILAEAQAVAEEISARWIAVDAANGIAEAQLSLGWVELARASFKTAENKAARDSDHYEHARAAIGLGKCAEVTQDFDAAQQHYLQAAKILDFIESLAASTWRARAEELAR